MNKTIIRPTTKRKGRPATGTIFQKGDRWAVRVTLPTGRRASFVLPVGTTEDAARAAATHLAGRIARGEVVDARAEGRPPSPAPRTIGDMLSAWLEIVDARADLAPATREGHRSAAARIGADFGAMLPADLDVGALRRWVRGLRAELSGSRVRNIFWSLSRFLDDAEAEGWHKAGNPCRNAKVREELPPVAPSREDVAHHSIEEAARLLAHVRHVAPVRFVRYLLAFTSGLRDGELAGLRWSSLATEHGVPVLRVTSAVALRGDDGHATRRQPKTRASKRPVPLHPLAAAELERWRAEGWRAYVGRDPGDDDPILPGPDGEEHRPRSSELLRADLRAAGLPDAFAGEPFEFRSTRRSFATWLAAAGASGETIDRLLRHVDPSVRARHYQGETPEALARLGAAVALLALPTSVDRFVDPVGGSPGVEDAKSAESWAPPARLERTTFGLGSRGETRARGKRGETAASARASASEIPAENDAPPLSLTEGVNELSGLAQGLAGLASFDVLEAELARLDGAEPTTVGGAS